MAPAIERRRSAAAAFPPSDTELVRQGTTGVVTGLPLMLLHSEGVALLAMAAVLYGRQARAVVVAVPGAAAGPGSWPPRSAVEQACQRRDL